MPRRKKINKTSEDITEMQEKVATSYLRSEFYSSVAIDSSKIRFSLDDEAYQPNNAQICNAMKEQVDKVLEGDLNTLQRRLATQAITLENISTTYLLKMSQTQYVNQTEAYAKIALKAQDQSRKTLATIAEIKNPKRTAFIKQLQMNQFNNNTNQSENSESFAESKNELNNNNQLNKGKEYATLDIGSTEKAVSEMQEQSALA